MMVALLEQAAPALLVCLPGIMWLGRGLLARAGLGEAQTSSLAAATGVATWLVCVHVLALAAGSFYVGLWLGSLISSLWGWRWRSPGLVSFDWPLLLTGAVAASAIAVLAFGWAFHDETPLVGHTPITTQILADHYPPRFVSFPWTDLRYHYGFNLFSAAAGAERC